MNVRSALAGNPNSGKTTLFNALSAVFTDMAQMEQDQGSSDLASLSSLLGGGDSDDDGLARPHRGRRLADRQLGLLTAGILK